MVSGNRLLTLSPRRIAGGYLVFGVLWIVLSDRLVFAIAESQASIARIQTVKGWVFVLGSAALLFGLTRTRESQIESAQDRLDRATQELQVLHRVFRHNIRNDLNVVQGCIQMVRNSIEDQDFEDWLGKAHVSTEQILTMSEKLRILDRADLRPTTTGTVDVVDVIRKERGDFESVYPDVTIKTELPEESTILGDESLRYVFDELFENAMEHHHLPEDQRRISVSVDHSISEVTVRFSDNGPGIPENELAALKSGEETQLTHASGVGLWLVKWLCSFNGGTVSFDTERSEGTTVYLSFPAAQPVEGLTTLVGNGGGYRATT